MKMTEELKSLLKGIFPKIRRRTAGALIAANLVLIITPAFSEAAYSADMNGYSEENAYMPPLAVSDETMYVNLDYYGAVEKVNVVKGVSSSAEMEYTDYGDYLEVTNMSGNEPIESIEGGVRLKLPGGAKKLYYEGKLAPESVKLPWSFELSYKLNGLPVEAKELAGASGLVELDIKVCPDEGCGEYMRNNMLLSCIVPIDDEKIYSVDAPGSQTQTVGDLTGVMFSALPGEEKEFTVRLGCEDYESIGVIFLIVPATMDSFDNIKDIKELKDTWKTGGDSMYDSMDYMLSVIESLEGEMDALEGSLNYMESARQTVSNNKNAIFDAGDNTAEALKRLSAASTELVPYLSSGQAALEKLDNNLDAMIITLSSMQKPLNNMFWGFDRLQDGAYAMSSDIDGIKPYIEEFKENDRELQEEIDRLFGTLDEAEIFNIDAEDYLSSADYEDMIREYVSDELLELIDQMPEELYDEAESDEDELLRYLDDMELPEAYGSGDMALLSLTDLVERLKGIKDIFEAVSNQKDTIVKIASASEALVNSTDRLINGAGKASGGAKMLSHEFINLINDIRNFDAIIGLYYTDLQNSIGSVQKLLGEVAGTLDSTAASLTLVQNTIREASDDMDEGLRLSIQSSLSLIEKSRDIFDATAGIRESGDLLKETLDEEVEKFENENTFLNIDTEARPVSFTSEKNSSPNSVQILIRTDEISEEDDEEVFDAEKEEEGAGIFARIKAVFVKIWEAIKGIFS